MITREAPSSLTRSELRCVVMEEFCSAVIETSVSQLLLICKDAFISRGVGKELVGETHIIDRDDACNLCEEAARLVKPRLQVARLS